MLEDATEKLKEEIAATKALLAHGQHLLATMQTYTMLADAQLTKLTVALDEFEECLETPDKPLVSIRVLSEQEGEEGMADRIEFMLDFDATADADVVSRHVKVEDAAGTVLLDQDISKDAESHGPYVADQDSNLRIVVTTTDDAGNPSTAMADVPVLDTLAPATPGMPSIRAISESEAPENP